VEQENEGGAELIRMVDEGKIRVAAGHARIFLFSG
jgi:hypothetical protein